MNNYTKEVNLAKCWFKEKLETLFSKKMKPYERAGNFIMIEFPSYNEKMSLLQFLAENNIFVRDCTQGYSVRKCFRITIGTKKQMEIVLNVMMKYYAI